MNEVEVDDEEMQESDGCYIVHRMNQAAFRKKLVEHFVILFHQNKVVWPVRTGLQRPREVCEC